MQTVSDDPPSLIPADDASHIGTISDQGSDVPVNPVTDSQMVQARWTPSTDDRSTSSKSPRNIRPMHVRLSVRVHHISFLHPGLDAGGATLTTNRGKSKTWLPTKNDTPAGAPGPMAFGPRRGSWKNPTKSKAFRRGSSADDSKHPGNYMKEETVTAAMDAAEVSEIISSEAYRLSRDGIIQQHYALMRQQQPVMGATSPRAADLSETARYYKECANRPKGYRRIVVSSMIPLEDDKIPSPPVKKSNVFSKKMVDGVGFDKASSMPEEEEDTFDNVEYRYVGPPNTGPAFFELLRQNGAASFGRFLPEVACSVPKHSIAFELNKAKGMKHSGSASTQPIVIEAPHVIWGDARDKALARIANEGCPLIDAREFEYVSNANLKEAELSETLMVCGATVWVQNATDDDMSRGTKSTIRSKNANMVKAEYYGGKMTDGVKNTAKGVAKGVADAGKMLSPKPKAKTRDASVSASVTSNNPESGNQEAKKKRVKFGSMPKLRRKKKKNTTGDVVNNASAGLDDASIASLASESIGTQPGVITSTAITSEGHSPPLPREAADMESSSEHGSTQYTIAKSVPYVLILDDVINIQIVSFPEKDIIAKFPISVASVMAQRNIDERIGDPLKPSELTATLIQEPNAPKLQWGVELKVTVRAVEVKPQVPRIVIPENMGKTQFEIEREQQLNQAIVSAGLGREYGSVRMQQMFYDEREHKVIERKVKSRRRLSLCEQNLLKDVRCDPSAMAQITSYNDEQKILKLLSTHFPGVDASTVATPKRRNSARKGGGDIKASMSLAIAESLDNNLGEYLNVPTVELVKKSLMQQSLLGHSVDETPMTATEVKEWCYDVASKLSLSASPKGDTSKRFISQIQDVLVSSAGGGMAESFTFPTNEEEKEQSPDVMDEVNGWCMTVLSKLDSCAEGLADHDDDESTQFSFHGEVLNESDGSVASSPKLEDVVEPSIAVEYSDDFQLFLPQITAKQQENSIDVNSINSDDEVWQQATARRESANRNSGSLQRVLRASSLTTFNEAVHGEMIPSRKVEPLLKSMRENHFQIHRKNLQDDQVKSSGSSPRRVNNVSPREEAKDNYGGSTLKACNRMGYLVAIIFVFFVAIVATRYFGLVVVVQK